MRSFLRQQRLLLLAAAAIAIWLFALPSLLRIGPLTGLNAAVSLESGRELVTVVKIDEVDRYDCALALQPRGTLVDELTHLYASHIARDLPQFPGILRLDFQCSAYRIDRPAEVHSAHSVGSIDFDLLPSIHLSRVRVEHFFGFPLEPGIYVVKGSLKADPAVLARLHLAAHLELPRRPPDGIRWLHESGLHQALAASPLLLFLLASLGGVLFWRSIVALLPSFFARPRGDAEPSMLTAFRNLPSGKKKAVLSLPLLIVCLVVLSLPLPQRIKPPLETIFAISLAVLVVGLIEARWSARIAKWNESFAALHPVARGLLATAVVMASVVAALFLVRTIGNLAVSLPATPKDSPALPPQTGKPDIQQPPAEPPGDAAAASSPSIYDSPYYWKPQLPLPTKDAFQAAEIAGEKESDALLSQTQSDEVRKILAAHKCESDNLLVYSLPGKPEKLVTSECFRVSEPANQYHDAWYEIEYPVMVSVAPTAVSEVESLTAAGFGFMYQSGSLKAVTDLNNNGRLELWLEGAICECDGDEDAEEASQEPCDCNGTSVAEIFNGTLRLYEP